LQLILKKIAEIAKKSNSKLIVDTSGEALKVLEVGVYMIKPNVGELAKLTGWSDWNWKK
jgi:6-phosphofructokinase 2